MLPAYLRGVFVDAHWRMRNEGREPVEFVEVQSGSYLAEDDIVRYEDDYGRKG